MRGHRRGAEPGGDRGRGEEAGLEGEAAGEQVAAHGQLRAQQRRHGTQRHRVVGRGGSPFPVQGTQEQPRPHRLARDVGHGRPDEPQARQAPRPCTSGAHSSADTPLPAST